MNRTHHVVLWGLSSSLFLRLSVVLFLAADESRGRERRDSSTDTAGLVQENMDMRNKERLYKPPEKLFPACFEPRLAKTTSH